MYTVGYSLYYGYSLICQSYELLFISLIAHLLQLGFLIFIEEPHIKRIYGNGSDQSSSESETSELMKQVNSILYDSKNGLFPEKSDGLFFFKMNIFKFQDIALIICSLYVFIMNLLVYDRRWCILQVIIWNLIHWLGLGGLLFAQSRAEVYTRWYINHGRPLYEAFSNWKSLYNFSLSINNVVFIACCIRYFDGSILKQIYNQFRADAAGMIQTFKQAKAETQKQLEVAKQNGNKKAIARAELQLEQIERSATYGMDLINTD